MAKPIFVVGAPRTGTTWVANILCRHSDVAGIQTERHYGIHESSFFSHLKRYFGDPSKGNNFKIFLEKFKNSDYFRFSGLDESFIDNYQGPQKYGCFFRNLMNEFATTKNSKYWVEKTTSHTLTLPEIKNVFPNAYFVATKRNIIDTVRSAIGLKVRNETIGKNDGTSKKLHILIEVFRYHTFRKHVTRFARLNSSIHTIEFEKLINEKDHVVKQLCQFLGFNYEKSMLDQQFKPNTSFAGNKDRKTTLNSQEKRLIEFLDHQISRLPFSVFRGAFQLKQRVLRNRLPNSFRSPR